MDSNGNKRAELDELSGLDRAGLTAISILPPPAAPAAPPVPPVPPVTPPAQSAEPPAPPVQQPAPPAAPPAQAAEPPSAPQAGASDSSDPAPAPTGENANVPPRRPFLGIDRSTLAAPVEGLTVGRGRFAGLGGRSDAFALAAGSSGNRSALAQGRGDGFDRLAAQLVALRAGLEGGDSPRFVLAREGLNQFDFPDSGIGAQLREIGEAGAADARAAASAIDPAGSLADARVAKIVQDMATFGARAGEADWKRDGGAQPRYDFFAA
jgi:hypothetical protein